MTFPLLNLGSEFLKLLRYTYSKKQYVVALALLFFIIRYYYLKNRCRNDNNKKLTL